MYKQIIYIEILNFKKIESQNYRKFAKFYKSHHNYKSQLCLRHSLSQKYALDTF